MNTAKAIPEFYVKHYEVDDVKYTDKIEEVIKEINPETIYIYHGVDSDSGLEPKIPDFPIMKEYQINKVDLY